MKKVKILQVLPSLSQTNGVAAYACNYFSKMDKNKFEFTFLVLNDRPKDRYNEIYLNGGKIIELYRQKNIIKYFKLLSSIFQNNKYDIIHCHVMNYGALILYCAKKYGIKVRIIHSHVTKSGETIFKKIRNDIVSIFTKRMANVYFACSKVAGKSVFKNKKFIVINNAINISNYLFDENIRKKVRKEFKINKSLLLGNVGRLCYQKNQQFLLKIVKELVNKNIDCKLMIVGDGKLKNKLLKLTEKYNIKENVIFVGARSDVNKLYNAFDIFVFPSNYEGLGIAAVEAQCNSLTCLVSNSLPRELKINDNVLFLKNNNLNEWIEKLSKKSNYSRTSENKINESNFNILNEVHNLEKLYSTLIKTIK